VGDPEGALAFGEHHGVGQGAQIEVEAALPAGERPGLAGQEGGGDPGARQGVDQGLAPLGVGAGEVGQDALALADALDRLDPRQRQVVEYRLFAGMEESEIAQLLDVSERTVRRDWVKGRAWLMQALMLKGPT